MRDIDADLLLLQEVGEIPNDFRHAFQLVEVIPSKRAGGQQKFKTAILVKGQITGKLDLISHMDWVNNERDWFKGNIVACKVTIAGASPINVVSVYSPAWPIDPIRLQGIDVSSVKLERNPDVWCTEILWSLLVESIKNQSGAWVVGGDFNASETFDAWKIGGRGNRQMIDRFNALGLEDCLRRYHGKLVPTFRNPRGGAIIHQIDHLYVSEPLLSGLRGCDVGSQEVVFGQGISDHLPIVASFDVA